ncbi:hypothetical protein ACRXTG_002253 [Pseudomonas aeruginosa]
MLIKNKDDLYQAIISYSPSDFVSHFIFEPIPFIFDNEISSWIKWKSELGASIEVDPKDIILTGSASLGFSLNPHKEYKPFDETSDIDCGIISSHHFDIAWRYLRQKRPEWLNLDRTTKDAIKTHSRNYVFEGTIATDKILGILPFGKTWQSALDKMATLEPTTNREVKLRIYKDYDSLRQYQTNNLEKLRTNITQNADEFEIKVED